jgi:hypothetical protein
MKFQELVSITGMPGLYQLISTKSDGAIVRSIDDNTTKFVAARSHSVTALDGIEVFTINENMRLLEVFQTMKSNWESAGEFNASKADNKAIQSHFAKLFPIYDAQKVYVSDMKKMIKWCGILEAKGLLTVQVPANETLEAPEVNAAAETKAPKTKSTKTNTGAESEEAKTKKPAKKKDAKKEAE